MKIPITHLVSVGGSAKVTHHSTFSLALRRQVGYIFVSHPIGTRPLHQLGDKLDLAGTHWWDRRTRARPGAFH